MRKIIVCVAVLCLLLCGCSPQSTEKDDGKIKITTTLFCEYDFARAAAGDAAQIKMLIPAGSDIHSYEPSLDDLAAVKQSDVFIYIGAQSDVWLEKILQNIDTRKTAVIKMSDYVSLIRESHDEHEHEHHGATHNEAEYDEHIWTSPENARKMIDAVCTVLSDKYPDKAEEFRQNTLAYKQKIDAADRQTAEIINTAKNKKIVVADRFPFEYFTQYYGLYHDQAFGGCEQDTDIDIMTAARLINTVKSENLSAVYRIELSSGATAQAVARKTGVPVLELHSAHNISAQDFKDGTTYVDIMYRNAQALREGLN